MAEVCVVGAGVAGLAAALRLGQAGHRVTVLEAKPRLGGLSHTVRDGDVVCEAGPEGSSVLQTADLAPGQYVNLGPGRVPHHHRRVLDLCGELGVALEPYIMSSDANYFVTARTGARYRRRRIEHDVRGWVAALAYTRQDPPGLRDMVASFGDLRDGAYVGTDRAGDGDPVPVDELYGLEFWRHRFWQPVSYLWQATMFQPVGGMDRIWRAMAGRIESPVVTNAPVERIVTRDLDVEVTWRERGRVRRQRFDWCLSSAPLPVLASMRVDGLDRQWRRAIRTARFAPAAKVGWQAASRWWESDTEQIYGGISYTDHAIQQFWYPSVGHHSAGPVTITGAYAAYGAAEALVRGTVADRLARARAGGALIHPEVADPDLVPERHGVSVAWHRVPYQAGGWCDWDPSASGHAEAFATLQGSCGRLVVIGDQVSAWPGWQEGCLASVERAAAIVAGQEPRGVAEVPDARWLTQGDHPWGPEVAVV